MACDALSDSLPPLLDEADLRESRNMVLDVVRTLGVSCQICKEMKLDTPDRQREKLMFVIGEKAGNDPSNADSLVEVVSPLVHSQLGGCIVD